MPDIVFPEDDCLWEVYVSYIISVMDFYCIIMGDDYAVSSIPAQCLKICIEGSGCVSDCNKLPVLQKFNIRINVYSYLLLCLLIFVNCIISVDYTVT